MMNQTVTSIPAYVASCVLATVANLVVFAILKLFMSSLVAAAVAWAVATCIAYVVCRHWAFAGQTAPSVRGMFLELSCFFASRAATGAADVALTWVLCTIGLYPLLSKVLGSIFSGFANFIAAKLAVFRS